VHLAVAMGKVVKSQDAVSVTPVLGLWNAISSESDINLTVSDNFLFLSWALGLGGTMAVNYSRSLMLLSAVRLSCRHTLFVVVVGFCASFWSSVWNLPGKAIGNMSVGCS
jgi:hypothetical protein